MEDEWIFLGDGIGGRSDTDSASSDDDSGFTIVLRRRRGGDRCSVVVSDADDAPAQPRVAPAAVPQPTPPGLSSHIFDMLLPRERTIDDAPAPQPRVAPVALPQPTPPGLSSHICDMLLPRERTIDDEEGACGADMDDYEDESEHGYMDYEAEIGMLLPRERAIDGSDGEEEAATAAACGYNAEPSDGTRQPEFAGRARGYDYDDVDTDSDKEDQGDDYEVAAHVNGTSLLYGWPRATSGVESQRWRIASQRQAERLALWENFELWVLDDLLRQLTAEAFELCLHAAAHGGPAAERCACARTGEALLTLRHWERALAIEEVRRREAAQQELDRALARAAAAADMALELALHSCPTAKPVVDREESSVWSVIESPLVSDRSLGRPSRIQLIVGLKLLG
jgi:hypothetical protein